MFLMKPIETLRYDHKKYSNRCTKNTMSLKFKPRIGEQLGGKLLYPDAVEKAPEMIDIFQV